MNPDHPNTQNLRHPGGSNVHANFFGWRTCGTPRRANSEPFGFSVDEDCQLLEINGWVIHSSKTGDIYIYTHSIYIYT